jgi:flavin-dependent trigonelline monooxygenase, reductase component
MTVATLDPRALRDAFGAFVTGVTIVTTRDEAGKPVGFTANSFTSVSLDPPLLLICLARTSRNFATMTGAKNFAVNILSEGQKDLSNTFARPVEDRFAAAIWSDAPAGSPVFTDVAAWFECSMQEVIEAGDAFENSGLNGLGYARGGYFTPMLAAKALSAAAEGEIAVGAVLERRGEIYLVGEDVLSLPGCVVAGGDPVAALTARLEELTGLTVRTGFLYSVYENKADGRQHIVYHALADGDDAPRQGRFLLPGALASAKFDSGATADIVNRFALESSIGNFGVYVGNETAGRVHPISMKAANP